VSEILPQDVNAHSGIHQLRTPVSTNYLREQRLGRALSTGEVAARLGVHPTSVLRWERRERLPAPAHLRGLAQVLRVETREVAGFFDAARGRPGPEVASVRGHGLRPLRTAARMPAPRIAEAVGVPAATVYNWEAGRARIPLHRLPRLARALGLEARALHELLTRARPVPSAPRRTELALLRRRTGLSRAAVAERIGVSRHSLGAWERDRPPPLSALRRLAGVYGVPVGVVARAAGIGAPPLLDRRRWRPGDLPALLRTLREWGGLTQRQVAEWCGCSTDAVRGWERGRSIPRPATRARLESLHGLAPGELLRAFP
jgi:transcriptional regulator with XRE-family HTH domain